MDTDYYRRLFHGAKEACEDWKYRCWIMEAIALISILCNIWQACR